MADNDNIYVHSCDVLNKQGYVNYKQCNLFTHPLYYIQNLVNDPSTPFLNNISSNVRDKVKCLLFLHTLPFNYDEVKNLATCFNKSDNIGGFETMPKGYLLLLGGLVWRKKYIELDNQHRDPILYKEGNLSYKNPWLYLADSHVGTLFQQYNSGIKFTAELGEGTAANIIDTSEFVRFKNEPLIENTLMEYFNKFVQEGFQEVKNCCELKKRSNNRTIDLTGNDIKNLINLIYNNCNTIGESTNVLNGDAEINGLGFKMVGFKEKYQFGFPYGNVMYAYFKDSNNISSLFKQLYFEEALVSTIPTNSLKTVPVDTLHQYFNGFGDMIRNCGEIDKQQATINETVEDDSVEVKDFKCEIYYTLKNIWDRWFCTYYKEGLLEYFKVSEFFDKNFIFIDSFYNNIYNVLKLNCSKVYAQYANKQSNQTYLGVSTVAHLGNVASDHMCMLFNFPDNINFAEMDRNGGTKKGDMMQRMKDVFTPLPANKIGLPEYSNKFTVIYTHSANKLDTVDRVNFVHDSFDIWSFNEGTDVAPTVFKNGRDTYDDADADMLTADSRIAYKVPAFGVAYSRQNNSYWKNIRVGMDNFNVTEQAIRAEAYIANKGNSEGHNITFYGQDIYSLYQAYSYLVTIEMMGDAQIQPLMYFQLMNVPMFRGTYMIIRVEHKITPGNMTTVFTGMKMSKVQTPYAANWVTKSATYKSVPPKPNMDTSDNGTPINAIDRNGNEIQIDIQDDALSKAINASLDGDKYCDSFVTSVYDKLKNYKKIKSVQGSLVEGDLMYYQNNPEQHNMLKLLQNASDKWKVTAFNPSINKGTFGTMMLGSRSVGGNNRPIVGDLLFGYHDSKVTGKPDHVAIYLGYHGDSQYVAEGVSRTGNTTVNTTEGIQVIAISKSRLAGSSDSIVYFANCKAVEISQTYESVNYQGQTKVPNGGSNSVNSANIDNTDNINITTPVVNTSNTDIKPFSLTMEYPYGLIHNIESYNLLEKTVYNTVQMDIPYTKEGYKVMTKQDIINNLTYLVNTILRPIYNEVDVVNTTYYRAKDTDKVQFNVNGAYRCSRYNTSLAGASNTSDHQIGFAADISVRVNGGRDYKANYKLSRTIVTWIINNQLTVDQFIMYSDNNEPSSKGDIDYIKTHTLTDIGFMHISNTNIGRNRGNIMFKATSGYITVSYYDAKYIFGLQ